RDAGFFKRAKAKHDARTHRAALEDRYGVALPGTDDERLSGADPLGDFDWLRNAAERQAHIHQPADETVSKLHVEVVQLQEQARRATDELNLCKVHGTPTSGQSQASRVKAATRTT